MGWDIKQMTMDVEGLGQYEVNWQPGTQGFALMLHVHRVTALPVVTCETRTIAIDDFYDGETCDWPEIDDAKAACAMHVELCKTMNPWDAAKIVWRELRKEAQAEERANRWDANDYSGGGL